MSNADEASEAGRLLASLVADRASFPDEAARDLKRLLGARLADPPMAAQRWDNLSLLVALIVAREGLLPTVADYESERTRRRADALAASTLVKRYGDWMAALRAATRVIRIDSSMPARVERARYRRPYRPGESAVALARFRRTFNTWPSHSEYTDWARISKSAARACGAPDPHLPSGSTVIRHFGSFDRALAAAKAFYRGSP
jgi:hypothetical protein